MDVTKRLIVNGDDFGWTAGISSGILECHREGILTSTTMLVNFPAFAAAAEAARKTPSLGCGVHLNLTHGAPVSSPGQVATLVNAKGDFLGGDAFFARLIRGKIDPQHLGREVNAQLDRFRSELGQPTHIDSHKHMHVFGCFRSVVAGLFGSLDPPRVRCPLERMTPSSLASPVHALKMMMLLYAGGRARRAFRRAGFAMPDYFMGVAATGKLTEEVCLAMLGRLRPGVTELMCHPGLPVAEQSEIAPGDKLTGSRPQEMRAVTGSTVKEFVKQHGIELVNYSRL